MLHVAFNGASRGGLPAAPTAATASVSEDAPNKGEKGSKYRKCSGCGWNQLVSDLTVACELCEH